MKTRLQTPALLAALITTLATSGLAQLAVPSDGSDGALNITANTVIDLSQAVTGVWSNSNTANAGNGIYDPAQWAVVFKYTSVTIASGATVTFANHPSRAPVVWLVNGNVEIDGELSLDGQPYSTDPVNLPEPGPGGFRGGAEQQADLSCGSGFGPGGGWDARGQYSYGNPQIVPLIGGSGGSGWLGYNGAGGGGAILIAAAGTITVNGYCHANGGTEGPSWGGSGGGVRLVANQILGNGTIDAVSVVYPGRTRLEANLASSALVVDPPTIAVSPLPLTIWPAATAPTVSVVSVNSLAAPSDPRANFTMGGDDITISATNGTINVALQTANFPTNGTVNVYLRPRNGAPSMNPASFVSGTSSSATWQLVTSAPIGHFIIQARAVSQ